MTSLAIRDQAQDPLLTPRNSALVIIDYQPIQVTSIASMDRRMLVNNIVSVARLAKLFRIPVVLSTVNVKPGRMHRRSIRSWRFSRESSRSTGRRSTPGRMQSS